MKKLLVTIPLMLMTFMGISQNDRFTFAVNTEPYAYDDGFNIGASIEYQMELMYFKAQAFAFPGLNGKGYFDWEGTLLGFNLRNRFDTDRIYAGFKVGLIYREGPHPKAGLEVGYEHYFRNGFYIGMEPSYDYRTDGRVWETDADNYWRLNNKIKFGYSW
jgi:hypothetical protein